MKNRRLFLSIFFLIILAAAIFYIQSQHQQPAPLPDGQLAVHFIDVGQADCILVTDGEHAALFDAGNNDDGEMVAGYLKKLGITQLDYAIGTHPHEDHIGGLDTVIKTLDVHSVILPAKQGDTKTYEDVLAAIRTRKVERITAQPGERYTVGSFTMDIYGPVKEYEDMNNNSVVAKIIFGETSFLLTGDIEAQAEKDILSSKYDVSCTVLKAPHHGSETSSSYVFLRAANPESVVIMCEKGNSYGHPHAGPLSRYRDVGATVYRTDTMGTIVMVSDGLRVSVNAEGVASPVGHTDQPGGLATDEEISPGEYIGNKKSKAFHLPDCPNLPAESNRIVFENRREALDAGYTPCGNCKP